MTDATQSGAESTSVLSLPSASVPHLGESGDLGQPRLELLGSLMAAINSDLDLQRVLQSVVDIATEISGAYFGAFFYNDRDENGHVYQLHVLSGAGLETFAAMPKPRITAVFEPTFTGVGSVRSDDITCDADFTGMPAGHLPVRSYLAVPVVTRTGHVVGALLFGHPECGRFDERCEQLIQIVAAQAAVAVENARLFAAEQAARRRAEQATRRFALLQSLSAKLAAVLTLDEAVRAVTDLMNSAMGASRVGLFTRVGGGWSHTGGRGSELAPMLRALPADLCSPVATAADTRSTVLISSPEEFAADYPVLASMLTRLPVTVLCLPLIHSGRIDGVCTLSWDHPRTLDAGDVEMLLTATAQLVSAMDRAELFAAERAARHDLAAAVDAATETARVLQRSLLPRALPAVAGLDIAVRYQASTSDAEVGGDWYDVVARPEGAVLVIGDVQGHNIAAAALMGQLRTGLHAYLSEGHHVGDAVARANRLLMDLATGTLATCCLVELNFESMTADVVLAGHLAPIVTSTAARGSAGPVADRPDLVVGLPLGVSYDASWQHTSLPLDEADRIVLYTDGLIERRDRPILSGVDLLHRAVAHVAAHTPDRAADALLEQLVDNGADDDIAVVVCDVSSASPPGRLDISITGDKTNIPMVRNAARAALRTWGLGHLEYRVALVVSELVTNVYRHGRTPGVLRMRELTHGVRIVVGDSDPTLPVMRRAVDDRECRGRGIAIVADLATHWGMHSHLDGKTVWADVTDSADGPALAVAAGG